MRKFPKSNLIYEFDVLIFSKRGYERLFLKLAHGNKPAIGKIPYDNSENYITF